MSAMVVTACLLAITTLLMRTSLILSVNGGASVTGILAGSPSLSASTRRLATCRWLIAMPRLKYWKGDQSMVRFSAVMRCSGLRKVTLAMCMRPYSEPLTPVMTMLPPLSRATRSASDCRVDSRPRYQ